MPITTFFCRNYKLNKQIKEQTKFRAFLLEHSFTIKRKRKLLLQKKKKLLQKRKRKQIEFLRRLDSPEFVFVSLPKQTAYYVYIIFQLFTLNAFFCQSFVSFSSIHQSEILLENKTPSIISLSESIDIWLSVITI